MSKKLFSKDIPKQPDNAFFYGNKDPYNNSVSASLTAQHSYGSTSINGSTKSSDSIVNPGISSNSVGVSNEIKLNDTIGITNSINHSKTSISGQLTKGKSIKLSETTHSEGINFHHNDNSVTSVFRESGSSRPPSYHVEHTVPLNNSGSMNFGFSRSSFGGYGGSFGFSFRF